MPALGADMDAGTVVEWLVGPGDPVHRGDVVAVVDTEKSMIDVECFDTGVVQQLLVPVGQKVPVGTPLALIGAEGATSAPPPPRPRSDHRRGKRRRSWPGTRPRRSPASRPPGRPGPRQVHGSGPAGAITRSDVERTLAARGGHRLRCRPTPASSPRPAASISPRSSPPGPTAWCVPPTCPPPPPRPPRSTAWAARPRPR